MSLTDADIAFWNGRSLTERKEGLLKIYFPGAELKASREDPYGELTHIEPTGLEEAARLLREATDHQYLTNKELCNARAALAALVKEKSLADTKHTEALHRMNISALAAREVTA